MPFFHVEEPEAVIPPNLTGVETISTPDYIQFDTTYNTDNTYGRLGWDSTNGTLRLGLIGSNVGVDLGEQVVTYCINKDTVTLNRGDVVYLSGAQGDKPAVKLAVNTGDLTSATTFGVVLETIGPNGLGYVMNKGTVTGLSLGAYTTGDIVYLGATPGTITKVKPVAPAHGVFIGVVLRANNGNGQLYVTPQNGYELNELHNVLITSPQEGQSLVYDDTNDLWVNRSLLSNVSLSLGMPVNAVDTIPRFAAPSSQAAVSGELWFAFFTPLQNMTVSQVSMGTAATAASGTTFAQVGLYTVDGAGNLSLVAYTAQDNNLFNATFTVFTRSFGGGSPANYQLVAGQRYALGVLVNATTMPTLYLGGFSNSAINALGPRNTGVLAGQVSLPATVSAPGGPAPAYVNANRIYWGRFS